MAKMYLNIEIDTATGETVMGALMAAGLTVPHTYAAVASVAEPAAIPEVALAGTNDGAEAPKATRKRRTKAEMAVEQPATPATPAPVTAELTYAGDLKPRLAKMFTKLGSGEAFSAWSANYPDFAPNLDWTSCPPEQFAAAVEALDAELAG